MNMIPLEHCIILSTIIFTIGVVGFILRRNILIVLMSLELMLNAVNLNLISFSYYTKSLSGQIFTIFIITVAAAEAAIGLAILVALYRNKPSVKKDDFNIMRG